MCWRVSRYYEALSTSEREELKSAREEAGRLGRGLQLDALGVEHARRASHPHSLSEPPSSSPFRIHCNHAGALDHTSCLYLISPCLAHPPTGFLGYVVGALSLRV